MLLTTLLLSTCVIFGILLGGSPVPFFCSVSNPACLDIFLNTSSILDTCLGDEDAVVSQNDVLMNGSSFAAMTVLFARGTAEPGMC